MAENTTTYKAIIETEVKGTKDIDEMNKKIEDGEGKFKSLKTQIRETTVKLQELEAAGDTTSKTVLELRNKLDDLGDTQKKVAFQSGQIEDKLAALPGPLGSVGKGFASM
jgi:septal ring factor EnvC (AmiA/AmiB activator)